MKKLLVLFCLLFMVISTGCSMTEEVPNGYVGMVMTRDGLQKEILNPGRHSCWGYDTMLLIDNKEETVTEHMKILCKDDLNLTLNIKPRVRLAISNSREENMRVFITLLNRKGSDMVPTGSYKILPFVTMYNTYVKSIVQTVARNEVSRYDTTSVRAKKEDISLIVFKKINEQLRKTGSPLELVSSPIENIDYPDIITKSMENKKKRQIEIEEEKAKQAKELLKIKNRKELAKEELIARKLEAKAEAEYNRILGESLTKTYIELRKVESQNRLYNQIKENDKVIITNGNSVSPMIDYRKK